jgi:hypothetical protein
MLIPLRTRIGELLLHLVHNKNDNIFNIATSFPIMKRRGIAEHLSVDI